MNIQGRDGASFPDSFVVNMDVDSHSGKGGQVGTFKCMEGARANLVEEESVTYKTGLLNLFQP